MLYQGPVLLTPKTNSVPAWPCRSERHRRVTAEVQNSEGERDKSKYGEAEEGDRADREWETDGETQRE